MTGATTPEARTPLHNWHSGRGARFRSSDGWQIPAAYQAAEAEVAAARSGVALADLSAFAKTSLLGRGVPALTRELLGESVASQPQGVAKLAANASVLACRLTVDHLLLLASTTRAVLPDRLGSLTGGAAVTHHDVTCAYAGFGLIGPHSEMILRRLTELDVEAAGPLSGWCAETSLAAVHALLVRCPGMTLPATRIYVAWDVGEYLWEVLLQAGRPFGIAPLGLDGWRSLMAH
jgi:glycine cleavage system aminomethyltransferase T